MSLLCHSEIFVWYLYTIVMVRENNKIIQSFIWQTLPDTERGMGGGGGGGAFIYKVVTKVGCRRSYKVYKKMPGKNYTFHSIFYL